MLLSVPPARFYAGIYWASEVHAVCILDAAGEGVSKFTVAHSAEGITGLLRRLGRLGDPGGIPVAIERPGGRLADLLLEAGHPVVPVSPNAIKAWRDGEVISGAKSDAHGRAGLSEYLRLRQRRLRAAPPYAGERPGRCAPSRGRAPTTGSVMAVPPDGAHAAGSGGAGPRCTGDLLRWPRPPRTRLRQKSIPSMVRAALPDVSMRCVRYIAARQLPGRICRCDSGAAQRSAYPGPGDKDECRMQGQAEKFADTTAGGSAWICFLAADTLPFRVQQEVASLP